MLSFHGRWARATKITVSPRSTRQSSPAWAYQVGRSVTQAAPWLLVVGPNPQYHFPGELVGNADPQAPLGPAKPGPAGDFEHV